MIKTFNAYSDPGHGWVKCPIKLLVELNIAKDISVYSYRRGEFAYLEEDSDASKLVEALKAKGVNDYKFKNNHGDRRSKIRSYECFDNSLYTEQT